jgi:hypothetical protein
MHREDEGKRVAAASRNLSGRGVAYGLMALASPVLQIVELSDAFAAVRRPGFFMYFLVKRTLHKHQRVRGGKARLKSWSDNARP